MLLQRKVDRAMKWSKERSLQAEGIDPEKEEIQAERAERFYTLYFRKILL